MFSRDTCEMIELLHRYTHLVAETIMCDHREVNINFIGIEQLIKNKKAVGRPKDIIDADYLERLKNTGSE